jgi:hypothetical protein
MIKRWSIGALLLSCVGLAFAGGPYTWTLGVPSAANKPPITLNPNSSAACSTNEDICWA